MPAQAEGFMKSSYLTNSVSCNPLFWSAYLAN